MSPSTDEIIKNGTLIRSTLPREMFQSDKGSFPKFRYYEYEGEEWAIPTVEYSEFLSHKDVPVENLRSLSDYRGNDLPGNIPRIRRFIDEFNTKYHNMSLYIWSRYNSTQKTTVSKAIIKELSEQGKKCSFVLANRLMSVVKDEGFSPEATQKTQIYSQADFLVIDDAFSSDKVTKYSSGYQVSFLDTFLRQRLEVDRKSTCFTSNIPIDEVGKYWGPSIQALLRRTTYSMEFNDVLGKDTDFDIDHIFD